MDGMVDIMGSDESIDIGVFSFEFYFNSSVYDNIMEDKVENAVSSYT
jgi:hypothetical protein